jgi:hypothetical protein
MAQDIRCAGRFAGSIFDTSAMIASLALAFNLPVLKAKFDTTSWRAYRTTVEWQRPAAMNRVDSDPHVGYNSV